VLQSTWISAGLRLAPTRQGCHRLSGDNRKVRDVGGRVRAADVLAGDVTGDHQVTHRGELGGLVVAVAEQPFDELEDTEVDVLVRFRHG
jgi:hypothetical protein